MAGAYRQRADGWPVGPEMMSGPGWSCSAPTVQLIEHPPTRAGARFTVVTLFPFRRVDLRHPARCFHSRTRASSYAFQCLRSAGGGGLNLPRHGGFDLARCGDFLGLEARVCKPRRRR